MCPSTDQWPLVGSTADTGQVNVGVFPDYLKLPMKEIKLIIPGSLCLQQASHPM